jgi:hypothetical protein
MVPLPKNEAVIEVALIAACVRAAATVLAVAQPALSGVPDASDVDDYARTLYELATGAPWARGDAVAFDLIAGVVTTDGS